MKRQVSMIACASLLMLLGEAFGTEFAERPKTSPDGRFHTRCYQPAGAPAGTEECEVSFYRLLASPETYHRRRIKVTGYLAQVFDHLVLFPSQASFEQGIDIEGLEIIDTRRVPAELRATARKGRAAVAVFGTFDANYVGMGQSRLGAMRDVTFAADAAPLPDRSSNWKP